MFCIGGKRSHRTSKNPDEIRDPTSTVPKMHSDPIGTLVVEPNMV